MLLGWASLVAQLVKNLPTIQETSSISGLGRSTEKGNWLPTLVFLPEEFCEQRSLVG